jgi:hypothetical protein
MDISMSKVLVRQSQEPSRLEIPVPEPCQIKVARPVIDIDDSVSLGPRREPARPHNTVQTPPAGICILCGVGNLRDRLSPFYVSP